MLDNFQIKRDDRLKPEGRPNGRIYEVNFEYNSKMGGYTTLMSGIAELYAIAR